MSGFRLYAQWNIQTSGQGFQIILSLCITNFNYLVIANLQKTNANKHVPSILLLLTDTLDDCQYVSWKGGINHHIYTRGRIISSVQAHEN
jgi:hypothetical protein